MNKFSEDYPIMEQNHMGLLMILVFTWMINFQIDRFVHFKTHKQVVAEYCDDHLVEACWFFYALFFFSCQR